MTYEIDYKKIGNRIKKERKALYRNQQDFAEAMSLSRESRQSIGNWETGKVLPSLQDLLRMCELFNCELGYLLCEYDCKTKVATDIQKVTGLTENSINEILEMLEIYNSYTEKYGFTRPILSYFFDEVSFSELLCNIERFAFEVTFFDIENLLINGNVHKPSKYAVVIPDNNIEEIGTGDQITGMRVKNLEIQDYSAIRTRLYADKFGDYITKVVKAIEEDMCDYFKNNPEKLRSLIISRMLKREVNTIGYD